MAAVRKVGASSYVLRLACTQQTWSLMLQSEMTRAVVTLAPGNEARGIFCLIVLLPSDTLTAKLGLEA